MNKLDYLDMRFEGAGSIPDLFKELGKLDTCEELEQSDNDVSEVEMKATTIRLPVDLLAAYDAVLKRFGLSRQDTFAYMVHDFISYSVTSYISGRIQQMIDAGVQFNDGDNIYKLHQDEFDSFIDSLPAADDVKERVKRICHFRFINSME